MREKDSARKRNERKVQPEKPAASTSAERMRKHRKALKVSFDFKKKNLSTPMQKSKERLNKCLGNKPREEKVGFLREVLASQSPATKKDIQFVSNSTPISSSTFTSSPSAPLVDAYTQLKGKRDKLRKDRTV